MITSQDTIVTEFWRRGCVKSKLDYGEADFGVRHIRELRIDLLVDQIEFIGREVDTHFVP